MNENTISDASLAGQPIDLTNCDREPIHIPGSIQPHGCLLACDNTARRVVYRSANAAAMLDLPGDPLGLPLAEVIGSEPAHRLLNALAVSGQKPRPALVFGMTVNGQELDATVHRFKGRTIVEFEPASDRLGTIISLSRTVIERLRATDDTERLIAQAAMLMQAQLGYDRVMVYQLGENGAGKVVAEAKLDEQESFRGQYFPASDIPQQARALYLRNPIRVIGDASFAPVPVLGDDPQAEPLDLSYAHLRSVSPIHCEYLRNMGVAASMSVSIIIDGALWGLIACHHHSPKVLGMADRAAAEMVGEFFSMHLDALTRKQARDAELDARRALDDLLVDASRNEDAGQALQSRLPDLAGLIAADGIAMWLDGCWTALGHAPDRAQAAPILALSEGLPEGQVFQTDCLSDLLPAADGLTAQPAGVMIIPLSRRPRDFLFYFRREAVQTLDWAGDPNKTYATGPFGDRLTPRKSFAIWKETVRHKSHPWSEADRRFAEALRIAVVEVLLFNSEVLADERARAAVRQRMLNQELNHRVKNILAVIQSLVSRKPRDDEALGDYADALRGRIRALAFAHDQVVRDDQGGLLGDLLGAELGPYADDGRPIRLDGPAVALDGRAFSVMALIFHEMATNAAKYGALSRPGGHLSVDWQIDSDGHCRIRWTEDGLEGLVPPQRSGFGSALIEQSLPFDLGGESRIDYRPQGIAAAFLLPADFIRLADPGPLARPRPIAAQASGHPLSGRRVLLVEDQTLIAMSLQAELEDHGLHVTGRAATVAAALALIQADPPDLAVLDVNLTAEDSLPVAETLRARTIPFVFATGYGRDIGLPEGFAEIPIVGKPYQIGDILQKLAEAEGRAR
ncbi:HWE histidine kinase domain-containing protein [Paracoccus sp. S3-43]|uniref:HWE histidine kinase domain-containing protein n=1 Tax=Paracoccus sp. S3-43 TaxID=3030011 RepID=UPI0023B1E509|nr:HWE histidine kinase domain-containing protein [Paracoccus sp. S3-43]WEF24216.1 HWE histidine kinase domain-containing protein [Paracoccus sp. S3-43]